MSEVYEAARRYLAAGLSVIPVRADGSKAPVLAGWREFARRLPTGAELAEWFGPGRDVGIGVVMGAASGNLVVLDFECRGDRPAYEEWASGLPPELAGPLRDCPVVRTPSGGRHVWVRLAAPAAGCRLARYANGAVKIEVRGEGHQVLAPGCSAKCHKTGGVYEFENEGWLAC